MLRKRVEPVSGAGRRRNPKAKEPARSAGESGAIGVAQEIRGTAECRRRRTRHQGKVRGCRIAISVDEAERLELEGAARENRLTVSAFVADRALAAARHQAPETPAGPLREAVENLMRAAAQLHRVGTNFNQAVAALNATGQPPGNLPQYARYADSVVHRLDDAVTAIRERLP